MSQYNSRFEIIEDELPPPKQKRKRKSKDRLSFNFMPWRLIIIAVTAGMTIAIALIFFVTQMRPPEPVALVAQSPDAAVPPQNHFMGQINDIAFSTTDVTAVSSANVHIYKGNDLLQVLDIPTATLNLNPDGTRLIALTTSTNSDGASYAALQLWDTASAKLLKEAKVDGANTPNAVQGKNLAFSPDGKFLATGTPSGMTILDASTLEVRGQIAENQAGTLALAFSSDGKRLSAIIQYYDYTTGHYSSLVRVWDIQDITVPQPLYSLPLYQPYATYAVISDDGRYLAYTSRSDSDTTPTDVIHIQDLFEQKQVGSIPCEPDTHITTLALTGNMLAFQQRGSIVSGNQNSLLVVHWSADASGFDYQTVAGPQPLRQLGVSHMRLWSDKDSSGIEYLALDTYTVLHWDFTTNIIKALPL